MLKVKTIKKKKKNGGKNAIGTFKKVLFAIPVIGLVVFLFYMLVLTFSSATDEKNLSKIESLYPEDPKMWTHIFNVEEPYEFEKDTFGAILPHSSLMVFELSKYYSGLANDLEPSLVVVLGTTPDDDFSTGVQTCKDCIFVSLDGMLEVDTDLVDGLVDKKLVTLNEQGFSSAESIYVQTPFIKHYFPRAKILPLIFNKEMSVDEIVRLRDWLDNNLPYDSIIVASINFSKYLPEGISDLHDKFAIRTINNFDFPNVKDLDVDAPSALYTFLGIMEKRGRGQADLLANFNSQEFVSAYSDDTSTYHLWSFFPGANEKINGLSTVFFGNMGEESTLNLIDSWVIGSDINKQLRDIRAKEDRFLLGTDFLFFDLEEGCTDHEENGMFVSFCKFVESDDEDVNKERLALIKQKNEDSALIYLLYEFKGGEIDEDRKYLIRNFVKNGVDIFVGRGMKTVSNFEYYKGSLIFYSLGDFFTDSKLANELTANSSGTILGINADYEWYSIYFNPIEIVNGYPRLKNYQDRANLFNIFISELLLPQNSVKYDSANGIVKIKR